MKKILLTILLPVVIAVVLVTCQKSEENQEKAAAPISDEAAVAVRLSNITDGDYSLPIVSSGLVTTGSESKLSFKVGGIVTRINVEEGQSVSKGQVLASLDLTEMDAQVAQARNNLEKMRRDLERVQRLYADSAATLEQLQNVQTGFDLATEGSHVASFNRQYAIIHANTNGKVIRKFVQEGELVAGGSTVLIINSAAENDWIVKIGLSDVDWVRVKTGDQAIVQTDAYPDVDFKAKVSLINEGADPVSGLYLVEVKIDAQGKKLATGLVATVKIVTSQKQRLKSIPIEAIVEGNGNDAFVFVVNDDLKSVRKLPVQIAYLTDSNAVVLSGLENVTRIITAGSAFLTEFSSIKITE